MYDVARLVMDLYGEALRGQTNTWGPARVRVPRGELPKALTPVYPTSAQMPQAYLRKAVASGLARADLSETLPPELLASLQTVVRAPWTLRDALRYLHQPGPDGAFAGPPQERPHPLGGPGEARVGGSDLSLTTKG